MQVMDLDEFYAINGVGSAFADTSLDTCRFPNGISKSAHRNMMKHTETKADEYYNKRAEIRAQYQALVDNGQIRPHTNIERTIRTAKGNPELMSVQAARRMCAKRGINWQTA